MTVILAFFSTFLGKAVLASLGVTAVGMLHNTRPYKGMRAAWGRLAYRGGALLSMLGKTKLGLLWQPMENFLLDFGAFGVEQAAAGLRSDNIEKTEDQLERLEGVGSITRAEALKDKLDLLRVDAGPLDAAQSEFLRRLNETAFLSTRERLEDK